MEMAENGASDCLTSSRCDASANSNELPSPELQNSEAMELEEKEERENTELDQIPASLSETAEPKMALEKVVEEISSMNNNVPFVKLSLSEVVNEREELSECVAKEVSDSELPETAPEASVGVGTVQSTAESIENSGIANHSDTMETSESHITESEKGEGAVMPALNALPPSEENLSTERLIISDELTVDPPQSGEKGRADSESPSSPEHQSIADDPSQIPEIPIINPILESETVVRSPSPLDNTLTIDEDRSSPASPAELEQPVQPNPVIIPEDNEHSVVAYFPSFEKQDGNKDEQATAKLHSGMGDHAYSLQGTADKIDSTPPLDTGPVIEKVESFKDETLPETKAEEKIDKQSVNVESAGLQSESDEVSRRDVRLKRENRYVRECRTSLEPETKKVNGEMTKTEKTFVKRRERTLSEVDHDYGTEKTNDNYCWICHSPAGVVNCQSCVRSYHLKCLPSDWKQPELGQCPECSKEDDLPNKLPKSDLYKGFCFAIQRIGCIIGYQTLSKTLETCIKQKPVDLVVNPVTFQTISERIEANHYASCRALLNDFNWAVHNMHLLELKSELKLAKLILKTAKQECGEIETCLECYIRANTQLDGWFVEPCQRPHLLVWARLKGYPYWPAKAMRHSDDRVDVRFFGAHDRAWVPTKDIFLYSRDIPQQPAKNKRSQNLEDCIDEIENHIVKLKKRFGGFSYHPNKFKFRAEDWDKNLLKMLPNYKQTVPKTRRQPSVDNSPAVKKRKFSSDDSVSSTQSEDIPIISVSLTEKESEKATKAPSPIPLPKLDEVATALPTPVASPAASDVTKSPESKEGVSTNPPLKIKVKLNSGKRGFATITPDRSPGRDERVVKVKKKKRRGSGRRTDAEESEPEAKRVFDSTETESNPSAPPTPSVIEPERVPAPAQEDESAMKENESAARTLPVLPQSDLPIERSPSEEQHQAAILDEEIQKLMTGRKSVSLVPKSPKAQSPGPELQVKLKRTARKSFPVPKPVVEEMVPEDITIKAEPVDFDDTPMAPPVTLPPPAPVSVIPKPRAAVPALRAIRPAVTMANVMPLQQVPIAPLVPRAISVRPGLTVRMVAPSQPTVRAPVVPIQPAQSNVAPVEPSGYLGDPLAIREIAQKEGERIATNLQFSIENILSELASMGNPYAQMAKMKVEMHNLKKKFQDQLDAAKKAADAKLNDTKNKLLAEKERALASARAAMLLEKKKAVEDTKKKQWCAQCGNEAFMYCCWNTSYCTYRCQQTHWPEHLKTCASTQKDKVPVAPVQAPNQNPVSLLVASQGVTHMTQNAFQTTVSVPQPITVAFGGPLTNANPLLNPNPPGAQKILLLSNGTAANGQFLLRTPTNLTVRPVMGNQVKQ